MNRSCPICSSSEKTVLYTQDFHNKIIALMDRYDVVVCKDCGFVYADNISEQTDFDNYYADMSKYEFNDRDGVATDDCMAYYKKVADFLIPYVKDVNARILDVGCSTGGLLSVFKSKGYLNLLGLDPAPLCVKAVKEIYAVEAVADNLSNFKTDEKFDLIILSATLEHIVDFGDSIRKISFLLKNQGILFVEVPDAERFDSFISAPFQQFSTEHINYFSRHSIANLLSRLSFEIIEIRQGRNKFNLTVDPDIFVLSKRADRGNFATTKEKDELSEPAIRNYIIQCRKDDEALKKRLEEKLSNKEKIIVWGVGTHTQRLLGAGIDISKILFFVDSNIIYSDKKLNGIDVKLPKDICGDAPILISTYAYQDEIAHHINDVLKLNNEIMKLY